VPGPAWRSADFKVCRIAGFQTRVPSADPTRSILRRSADLEIGDTAGLETRATPVLPALAKTSVKCLEEKDAETTDCGRRFRDNSIPPAQKKRPLLAKGGDIGENRNQALAAAGVGLKRFQE